MNDSSTHKTPEIVLAFAEKIRIYLFSKQKIRSHSFAGSKVIQAFHEGEKHIDANYDIIVKVDADLIFPTNYFETIIKEFQSDETIGMVGGFCYVEKKWRICTRKFNRQRLTFAVR